MAHLDAIGDSVPGTETRTTTCYMCACRCGIRVHLRDGVPRHIDGNPDHPVNRGVICGKGASGLMTQLSPAKLRKPLRRVGPRGENAFEEISWEEALGIAAGWLGAIRDSDPKRLAFFTGRDQSQALTGWWAQAFGTPNYAAHGGFCSVNMAAAGLYTLGGSFWEFGEADFEHAKLFVMFGVAEDHASNPLKLGISRLKARGAKFVSVNPVRTGYSAVADEWLGIRPGTDGLLLGAVAHELLRTGRIDREFLASYSNAACLVIDDPGAADHGLLARDGEGRPLSVAAGGAVGPADGAADPLLLDAAATLPDGRRAATAFRLLAARFGAADWAPAAVAERCGLSAATIRRFAAELAAAAFDDPPVLEVPWTDLQGRRHERMEGRGVSFHAMRGISAHANGFHTCRMLHVVQLLLGAVDRPGSFRYCPPFPKAAPPPVLPGGKAGEVAPGQPLAGGPPLGFPRGPQDLLVDGAGEPLRIDGAFSWEAPLAAHGAMQMVIRNAWAGRPYPIDTLMLFMANMSWNSAMNTTETMRMLTDRDPATGDYRIPHIIYADAFASEMVAYADLVLPDTTYLERHDCISLLDRPISDADGAADAIRQPVLAPDRDVRPFQSVLLDLGARLGLPGMTDADGGPRYPGGYADFIVNHQRSPGIGLLAGWRGADGSEAGRGAPNPEQLDRYAGNGCFWRHELAPGERYFRFANRDYLAWARQMGFVDRVAPIVLQLYCEPLQRFRLAAGGHGPVQPPERLRERIATAFDPLPIWYPPAGQAEDDAAGRGFHALTQRPMAMYHAWGSHNAWQRQIHGHNPLYLNRAVGQAMGLRDGDWVEVSGRLGNLTVPVRLMDGVQPDTVWTWNAVGKRRGTWGLDPDAAEGRTGFLLNHLIPDSLAAAAGSAAMALPNADPVTGQAAWYDLRVSLRPLPADRVPAVSAPQFPPLPPLPGQPARPARQGFRLGYRRDGGRGGA